MDYYDNQIMNGPIITHECVVALKATPGGWATLFPKIVKILQGFD